MEQFLLEPVELTDIELDAVAGGDSIGVAIASDDNVLVAAADDVSATLGPIRFSADSLVIGFSFS